MKKIVFIDTDMGNDDLIALCMLLISKKFTIKGISLVNGVSKVSTGAKNLTRIFTYINNNTIPIFMGKTKALNPKWKVGFPKSDCQRANNLTLLKKLSIPENFSNKVKVYKDLDQLYNLISSQKKKIILVCLGPLTNISFLMNKYGSKFTSKIKEIILMGGAIKVAGIVPPSNIAEYNIYLDPEAAKKVFDSEIPIKIVPIDATKFVPAMVSLVRNNKVRNELQTFYKWLASTKTSKKANQIIKELILSNKYDFNSFYDPLVSGIMINQKIIKKYLIGKVEIIIKGKNRGQTTFRAQKCSTIKIVSQIDRSLFYNQLLSLI